MTPSTRAIVTTRMATHTQNTPVNCDAFRANETDTIGLVVVLIGLAAICLFSALID